MDENEIGKIAAVLVGAYVAGDVAAVNAAIRKIPGGKFAQTAVLAVLGYLVYRFGESMGDIAAYLADFLYGMAAGRLADPMPTAASSAAAKGTSPWGTITSIPLTEGAELRY